MHFNYTVTTLDMYTMNCAGFGYWGVEYGGECYCRNAFILGALREIVAPCARGINLNTMGRQGRGIGWVHMAWPGII